MKLFVWEIYSYFVLHPKDPAFTPLILRADTHIIHSFIQEIVNSLSITGYRVATKGNDPCLADGGEGRPLSNIAQYETVVEKKHWV